MLWLDFHGIWEIDSVDCVPEKSCLNFGRLGLGSGSAHLLLASYDTVAEVHAVTSVHCQHD